MLYSNESFFKSLFIEVISLQKDKLIEKNEDLVNLLIKQSLYDNKELKSISLDLLHTLYSETYFLGQRLETIQIIEDEEQIKKMNAVHQIARQLFELTEDKENWYSVKSNMTLDSLKDHLKKLEQMLYKIERPIEDNISADESNERTPAMVQENSFLKSHLDSNFIDLNPFVQDLARNSQSINYICTMLKHSLESDTKSQNYMKPDSIVFNIFQILSELVHENKENKRVVMDHIGKDILKQLHDDSITSNAIIVLNNLICNNKDLVNSLFMTSQILTLLFNKLTKEHRRPLRMAYTLYTIQQFAFIEENTIRANQNLIMSSLISNSMSSVFSCFRQGSMVPYLKRQLTHPYNEFEYGNSKVKLLKPELCFFIGFMEVITVCCFDMNQFSEKIAQSLISLRDITELLTIENKPVILEHEICKFVYHVYIDIGKDHGGIVEVKGAFMAKAMQDIIASCLKRLKDEASLECSLLCHKELILEKSAVLDLLKCSSACLRKVIEITLKSPAAVIAEEELNDLYEQLNDLISEYRPMVEKNIELQEIITPLLVYIANISLKKTIPMQRNDSNELNKHQMIRPEISSSINTAMEVLGRSFSVLPNSTSKRADKLKTLYGRDERHKNMTNEIVTFIGQQATEQSFKFKKEFSDFKSSDEFEELAAGELKNMITENNVSSNNKKEEHLNRFFQSLVLYLDPENKASEETVKIGLKIFREYISKFIDEAELNKSSKSKSAMINAQDFLIRIGIVQLICKLILSQNNQEIISIAIDVGLQILMNGNLKGQTEFKKVLQTHKDAFQILKQLEKVLLTTFEDFSRIMIAKNAAQMREIFFGQTGKLAIDVRDLHENISTYNNLLKFFQLLCEGHNADLQNFLREQHLQTADNKSFENIDFITHSVIMFGSFVKFFNYDCFHTGIAIIDFLIESLQGPCKGNQDVVSKCKILDFCKDFINDLNSPQDLKSRGFFNNKDKYQDKGKEIEKDKEHRGITNNLFNKTIKLLLSVVEFNMDEQIVTSMGNNIDFSYLKERITGTYVEFAESLKASPEDSNLILKVNDKVFDERIKLGFNVFFFVKMVKDYTGIYSETILDLTGIDALAFEFFKENSGHLEVNFHGSIEKVYFMKHPACNYLDQENQTRLMAGVRRESANEKITDFLAFAPNLFNLMDHTFYLSKRRKITPVYLSIVRDLALLVSFAINLAMFVYLSKDVEYTVSYTSTSNIFNLVFSILGYVHLVLGCLMLIFQIVLKNPLVRLDHWRKYITKYSKLISRRKLNSDYESLIIRSVIQKDVMDVTADEMKLLISQIRKTDRKYSNVLANLIYCTLGVEFFLMDSTMLYFMFYILFSALAKFYSIWLLYCFALFDIIVS